MKKFFDVILIIIIFFVIYFLQSNFFIWFNIKGIRPNLFVIFIMMIGLFMKKKCGFIFGLLFGLLLDFFIGIKIGINAIALGIVGILAGVLDRNFSKDNRITIIIMTAVLTITTESIIAFFNVILMNATLDFTELIKIIILETVFNMILITALYPLFVSFGMKLENDFESKNDFFKIL